jgi:hypothetical protein
MELTISDAKGVCTRRGKSPVEQLVQAVQLLEQVHSACQAASASTLANETLEFLRPYKAIRKEVQERAES